VPIRAWRRVSQAGALYLDRSFARCRAARVATRDRPVCGRFRRLRGARPP